jgi:glutathione S-transferase
MLEEALLYDHSDSPFCLKARICLHVKEVPYRRVTVTLRRRRELRRLNPLGKVPVLVQGDQVIADSSAIARHLEAWRPEPALLPTEAAARAYSDLIEEWADEALYPIVVAFKWLNPANRDAALANTVRELEAGLLAPLVGRSLVRYVHRRYRLQGYAPEALGQFEDRMRANLETLGALLAGKPFLLGRAPVLADVAAFVQLSWMRRYAEARLLDDAPVVRAWLDRLGAIPAVAAALSS